MISHLKEIHSYSFVDHEYITYALNNGITILDRNPIKIAYTDDEFPRIENLENTNMIFKFVDAKFKSYSEDVNRENKSEKYLIEQLNIDSLKNFLYPFQVNLDLRNNIIEIENTYEYYNLIQIFKDNRESTKNTLFFIMNRELYFYNDDEFGFCSEYSFTENEIASILSAFDSEDQGLEVKIINDERVKLNVYTRESFGSYSLISFEDNKIKRNGEMPFTPRILKDRVQALYNDKIFFETESFNPSLSLLLNQSSRIMAYHPLRNPDLKCVHYIYESNGLFSIRNSSCESGVPKNVSMAHNWLLNIRIKEDVERNISPLTTLPN